MNRRTLVVLFAGALVACDGSPTAPESVQQQEPATVDLTVLVATAGEDRDADGYTLRVDGGAPLAVAPADSLTLRGLTPGEHLLALQNVAANCTVEGGAERTVHLALGDADPRARFPVECASLTGTLRMTAQVTGPGADPSGFSVSVDDAPGDELPGGDTLLIAGVPVGEHTVRLGDVDANCAVEGGQERTVDVPSGDTATVSFPVTCDLKRGSLDVSLATEGWQHGGYTVEIRGPDTAQADAPPTGSVAFEDVPVGSYRVLVPTPETCSGDAERSVEVEEGQRATAAFAFTCAAPSGGLAVEVITYGHDLDPDGYQLDLQGHGPVALPLTGSVVVHGVPSGTHAFSISGIAHHCSVLSGAPGSVTVSAGGTARLRLELQCAWRGPELLAPADGARILQNDPALPCPDHPTRGRGFRIRYDWTDAAHPRGVAHYEILAQHPDAQFPALSTTVAASALDRLSCTTFVIDRYLQGWQWWVRAIATDGEESAWSNAGVYHFQPCRLSDGTPCNAPG